MFRTEVVEESEKYRFYVQYTVFVILTALKIVEQTGCYECISEFAYSLAISKAVAMKENKKSLLKIVFINIRFVLFFYCSTLLQ